MKKILIMASIVLFVMVPIINVILFFNLNKGSITPDDEAIEQIVNPSRGWPEKNINQLYIWEYLYEQTQINLNEVNNKILTNFTNFYLSECNQYNVPAHAGESGYDKNGIPQKDIDTYYINNLYNSKEIQIYQALWIRSAFIELIINELNNPNNKTIVTEEFMNLWVMKYINSGIFYQWDKINVPIPGSDIYEYPIDIDFYTFGKYEKNWNEGPIIPPKDKLPIGKIKLTNKDEIKLINEVYADIFLNTINI